MTAEVLPNTKKIELINKKNFVVVALDKNKKTFMIYFIILLVALTIVISFFSNLYYLIAS